MSTRLIDWIPLDAEDSEPDLPKENFEVLISVRASSNPVALGYRMKGRWYYVTGAPVTFSVVAWAYKPEPYQ